MDAVKLLEELRRMCRANDCGECPWNRICPECLCGLSDMDIAATLAIVERWAEDHPEKTNSDKFIEVFGLEALEAALTGTERIWWDAPYVEPGTKE